MLTFATSLSAEQVPDRYTDPDSVTDTGTDREVVMQNRLRNVCEWNECV